MTQTSTCAKCGTLLPGDAPDEMCPKCLIVAGLLSEVGADALPTAEYLPSGQIVMPKEAAAKMPAVSRRFGGYRIIRPLGKGGMGTVYEAEEEATGRRLALKVLSHSLDSEQARTRFFREGRLAASVNHPNSVYVFGTEEIDGMPVITMEMAPGGTLQELIKRKGPLPIREAVDMILQIIAGLESAAVAGVLHRDVKPSNCFLDSDGMVKVGDFGLSISTLARGDTNLTTIGNLLGTPAFASPEQLRGDEIDSRSDIYAVGVTLFYLLTARLPFTADNMVQLLATVLERPAESPRKLRPEISDELAAVILRCLAKQPAQRFRNYEELRLALLPFTSAAPVPAGLGIRSLAGFIDFLLAVGIVMTALLGVIPVFFNSVTTTHPTRPYAIILFSLSFYLIPLLIFVLPEWRWAATLGKAVMGLRVVGLKRNAPGLFRILFRAVIMFGSFAAGGWFSLLAAHAAHASPVATIYLSILMPYGCLFGMFTTIRLRNGNAAVHDLLTGTRVVMKPNWQTRSSVAVPTRESAATTQGTPRIGPYHVLAEMGRSNQAVMFVGYDARLFRKVWIRHLPEGSAEISPAVRMLTRHARLRWLGGKRAGRENWDAYEALSGRRLTELLHQRQVWKDVRYWLADLADEIEAASKDQTLPATLALDRVWITDDGRAKLLDFPAPGSATGRPEERGDAVGMPLAPPTLPPGDWDAQLFLKHVAVAALEGRSAAGADLLPHVPKIPMPLHARGLLMQMGEFRSLKLLTDQLRRIRALPAEISAARRLTLLAGCVVPAAMLIAIGMITVWFGMRMMNAKDTPEFHQFVELKMCISQLEELKDPKKRDGMEQSLEIYMAGRFKDLAANEKAWHNPVYNGIVSPEQHKMVEGIIAARGPVSEKDFELARKRVEPLGVEMPVTKDADADKLRLNRQTILVSAATVIGLWSIYAGIPALIAAISFRGGVLLHGLGFAVVGRDGAPARRWRVFCRAMIVWMPPLLAGIFLSRLSPLLALSILFPMLGVYIGASLWSLRRPDRGIQDWIVRTQIVMK